MNEHLSYLGHTLYRATGAEAANEKLETLVNIPGMPGRQRYSQVASAINRSQAFPIVERVIRAEPHANNLKRAGALLMDTATITIACAAGSVAQQNGIDFAQGLIIVLAAKFAGNAIVHATADLAERFSVIRS